MTEELKELLSEESLDRIIQFYADDYDFSCDPFLVKQLIAGAVHDISSKVSEILNKN